MFGDKKLLKATGAEILSRILNQNDVKGEKEVEGCYRKQQLEERMEGVRVHKILMNVPQWALRIFKRHLT